MVWLLWKLLRRVEDLEKRVKGLEEAVREGSNFI